MIVSDQSPLRRLHANLNPHQGSFLDGIRISGEMIDVAYSRMCEHLWDSANSETLPMPVAAVFLDAWAVIDSVHRLRHLLAQFPGLRKKQFPTYRQFEQTTAKASAFRNTIQHLRNELRTMGVEGWPSWGSLSWFAVINPSAGILRYCEVVPGRVQTGKRNVTNPAGMAFAGRVDHVYLSCKADRVSLSELYEQSEKMIQAIEPSLTKFIAEQPTLAADFILKITFQTPLEEVPFGSTPLSLPAAACRDTVEG